MTLTKVTSSQILETGWENDIMVVKFTTGSVYLYSGVPYKVYQEIITADSVGKKFNSVKNDYDFVKLTD